MSKLLSLLFVAAFLCIPVASCAPNVSPDTYSVGAVGQVNRVVRGVIVSARDVAIAGTNTGIGAGGAAIAGGVGGAQIGGSVDANIVGAVAGVVAGGIIGALAEDAMTRQSGIEYVIETENGALITVVQGNDDPLDTGQRVLVIYGTRARVIADDT